jgi:hypothetical protein
LTSRGSVSASSTSAYRLNCHTSCPSGRVVGCRRAVSRSGTKQVERDRL